MEGSGVEGYGMATVLIEKFVFSLATNGDSVYRVASGVLGRFITVVSFSFVQTASYSRPSIAIWSFAKSILIVGHFAIEATKRRIDSTAGWGKINKVGRVRQAIILRTISSIAFPFQLYGLARFACDRSCDNNRRWPCSEIIKRALQFMNKFFRFVRRGL